MNTIMIIIIILCLALGVTLPKVTFTATPLASIIAENKPLFGKDLLAIELHLESSLESFSTSLNYRRSIIKVGLYEEGNVKNITAVNHPYSKEKEARLLNIIEDMKWQLRMVKNSFI